MTKLRAMANLGMSGAGWTESKKSNLDKSDSEPSLRDWFRYALIADQARGLAHSTLRAAESLPWASATL
jgi:hypothetical protein